VDPAAPHPKLVPLLEKHGVDYALFRKQGRPRKGDEWVLEKRRDIVTELHEAGTSWVEMIEVTGLGNGAIQRATRAKWNEATRNRVKQNGVRLGNSWKGRKSARKSEALRDLWESGTFDFHRGRKRTPEEKDRLREGWTDERRDYFSGISKARWEDPEYKTKLLDYHRSDDERSRRSAEQTQRMKDSPEVYTRGRAQWVETPKGAKPRYYVRSSYEVAAVTLLERDESVRAYEYERRIETGDGKWILIDFVISRGDGSTLAVEVKAAWVLTYPGAEKERARLDQARSIATQSGWSFEVWTEKELRDAL
jgi:hypothetical protein